MSSVELVDFAIGFGVAFVFFALFAAYALQRSYDTGFLAGRRGR